MRKTKFIAIVGMAGAGKSVVSDEFVKAGYSYFRFGQIVLDEVKKRGLKPTDDTNAVEREVREELREKHGMAAMAILNVPKIEELLAVGNVIGDGLYSWSEYKVLREKYGERMKVVAVFSPPEMRYARLEGRSATVASDPSFRFRSFTKDSAKSRDYAEIEKVEKGGPIAMADFTIVNTGTEEDLVSDTKNLLEKIEQ